MTVFAERVQKVQQAMREQALLFVPAAKICVRNRDTHYRYRAHSDTLYLTGVNEEELSLIITNDALYIFALQADPERERWTGKVKGHAYFLDLFARAPFKLEIAAAHEWPQKLGELSRGCKVLYYDFGIDAELDSRVFAQIADRPQFARKGIYAPRSVTRAYELIAPLRLIKDDYDIEQMRKAATISASAHNTAIDFISSATRPLSEFELKALIEHEFMRQGADQLAYPSIVAASENATILHYEQSSHTAKVGDFVLIDAGAEYHGYASDITRTTPVGGFSAVTEIQRDLHALVHRAQRAAIAIAKPGTTIEEVHQTAVDTLVEGLLALGLFQRVPDRSSGEENTRSLISLKSRKEVAEHDYHTLFYMHRTSHFLGLDVHDVGDYHQEGKSRSLQKGMVITIEPGLYFPPEYDFLPNDVRGIGIRIEDDVLITDTGYEVLTAACRIA